MPPLMPWRESSRTARRARTEGVGPPGPPPAAPSRAGRPRPAKPAPRPQPGREVRAAQRAPGRPARGHTPPRRGCPIARSGRRSVQRSRKRTAGVQPAGSARVSARPKPTRAVTGSLAPALPAAGGFTLLRGALFRGAERATLGAGARREYLLTAHAVGNAESSQVPAEASPAEGGKPSEGPMTRSPEGRCALPPRTAEAGLGGDSGGGCGWARVGPGANPVTGGSSRQERSRARICLRDRSIS